MPDVKDKPQAETLAERFAREVSEKHLERLERNLDNAKDEIGFVSWAVEKAEAMLWDASDGFAEAAQIPRDELPTVTLQDVGRLHVFAADIDRIVEELQKDARNIRRVVHAFHGGTVLDGKRGDGDA